MTSALQSIIRRGITFARHLFSRRPEDSISLVGEAIQLVSGGQARTESVCSLRHLAVEQSFLGLFGSNLTLSIHSGEKIVVRGLDRDVANDLKRRLDERILELITEQQKEVLARSVPRVRQAYGLLSQDRYLSAWQMSCWEEDYSDLKFLCAISKETLEKAEAKRELLVCRDALLQPGSWRAIRNDRWVRKELYGKKSLLDSIGERPLTQSQREAILRHDNRVIAVAGAGTGKTTTVVGKVSYLLETGACKPEEILLLSFSRGAVEELQKRVAISCGNKVKVRTFHSLGLEIITQATGRKPAIFDQQSGVDLVSFVSNLLLDKLKSESAETRLVDFLAYYFYPTKSPEDFETHAQYLEHATSLDIRTLKGEKVRSNAEARIANWLFLQGISYDYEAMYKGTPTGSTLRRVYKPDFYLPEHGIYIEHWGIDRKNRTNRKVPTDRYLEDMQWKQELHRTHGTTLVETTTYQDWEGWLLQELEKQLTKHGVVPSPISRDDFPRRKELQQRVRSLAKLLATTVTLFKGDRLTIGGLRDIVEKSERPTERRRGQLFLEIFEEVLGKYEASLANKGEVDFGDMITEAAHYVETRQFMSPFRVVIVDEFQDISRGRAWFMNALIEQVEDSRLLCVGDDWQSIFRFTGSDVSLMTDYATQWPQAVRIDLDVTFRFNNKIEELSKTFVTKNAAQLKKRISCVKKREGAAVHITDKDVNEIVREIQTRHPGASYLILNRYRFNIRDEAIDIEDEAVANQRQMTIHKAKGKEADYVIVDNVEAGRYGLPTEMVDDPIIGLFLAQSDLFPNAEERRLFYVALTRTKNEVWLCVKPDSLSCFVDELINDPAYAGMVLVEADSLTNGRACHKCGSRMVGKTNRATGKVFLSCRHYPRCDGSQPGCPKCGQTIPMKKPGRFWCPSKTCGWEAEACPRCGVGFGETRSGKHGEFVGCSMYRFTQCNWIKR